MSATRPRIATALATVAIALFGGAVTLSSTAPSTGSPTLAAASALSQTHA